MKTIPYAKHVHGTPGDDVPALQYSDVTLRYPGAAKPVISHLTLNIPSAARVALVGANGAGKSTILRAAAGLLPIAGGTIRVHGSPVRGCCHRLAFLAQRGELDWRFPITVQRLVLTGRYAHLGWFRHPSANDLDRARQAMQLMKIEDLAEHRIGELSGGQQQRVLLARAIVQEASLLLLDEPLNAVDADTRSIVRQTLADLAETGKTIIAATHDPHDMEAASTMVVRVFDGRVSIEQNGGLDKSERTSAGLVT